jgi:hypothetical protein
MEPPDKELVASRGFQRPVAKASYHSPFPLTINKQIGFDRSAFARARVRASQLKTEESCVCAIHDEGLPELPIKSLKP